ncbi:MAG: hypothetical protein WBD24_02895 [Candidatus Omnitrophota bacterium]
MGRSKGVTFFGFAIVAYGIYNLLGAGSFKQFSIMFKGMPGLGIVGLYAFTLFYGICCVYCGIKALKLEDWARKTIVVLASISVILGFFLNRMVIRNFKEFILSDQSGITSGMMNGVYNYTIIIIVLATLFEISVIFYFTRPGVVRQFRPAQHGS